MHKPIPPEDYKLLSSFEMLCNTLSDDRFADRLDRKLGYFVLPNDRRLPRVFLPLTLRQIMQTPFHELSSAAGIGQKKISVMLRLMQRATKPLRPEPKGAELDGDHRSRDGDPHHAAERKFDPALVSEVVWEQWCEAICANGLGVETLGRLAISLRRLTTQMWDAQLSNYCNATLGEIRARKTHGEKRVQSILEIFYWVHDALTHAILADHLALRLAPRFIAPIERWLSQATAKPVSTNWESVRDGLVGPLLAQIRIDAAPEVAQLAEARLGIGCAPQQVRIQSKKLGVTRARVYQMLEECNRVMLVRWPEGSAQVAQLYDQLRLGPGEAEACRLVEQTIEMFFSAPEQLAKGAGKAAKA